MTEGISALSFLCPSQLDGVRFLQLFQRREDAGNGGKLRQQAVIQERLLRIRITTGNNWQDQIEEVVLLESGRCIRCVHKGNERAITIPTGFK